MGDLPPRPSLLEVLSSVRAGVVSILLTAVSHMAGHMLTVSALPVNEEVKGSPFSC